MNHPARAWKAETCRLAAAVLFALLPGTLFAAPQPGDVFREYRWTNTGGSAGGALRVGGKLDYGGGPIELPHRIDLEQATRAEVVIEKLLCHDGTRGLSVSFNDRGWIAVPEAAEIPAPAWEYQHHIYPVVELPLAHLRAGEPNTLRLKVDEEPPPQWPQNLVYGVHLRIYYDPQRKPSPVGRLVAPGPQAALGRSVELRAEASSPNGRIERVDFLGLFEDVNLEGDGRFRQWHYHYLRADLAGHIGTAAAEPWRIAWDTTWVPDQQEPLELAAWITDESGLTRFTEAVGGLSFDRGELSVELCAPYEVPQRWVTRRGEFQEKFRIAGDPRKATAARLVWCSWSPGYMEGVSINGIRVFDREGPRYDYFVHRVPLADLSVLQPGENVLATGKTPKINGQMVHGMEVNWPGILLLIQYDR